MIINFRYHIASLVAVFLALAIGILIGTTLLGNDTLAKTQQTIINDLRKNYDKIVTENRNSQTEIKNLQGNLKTRQDYESKTMPLLINNKLQGKQIVIIETNIVGSKNNIINTLTKIAGATIVSDTIIQDGLNIEDQNKREQLIKEINNTNELKKETDKSLNLDSKNKDNFMKDVSNLMAQSILSGQNKNTLNILDKNNIIKISGNYGVPVDAIVIIGGSSNVKINMVDNVDVPMINYFIEQKIPVYGVEESDIATSYIKNYQKLKITTIDDIDQISGQAALVWAIEKQIPGDFGIKNTAKQLLPNI